MQVVLEGLSARHPAAANTAVPALKPLSLSIAAGEQVAVIGPSGAGKTTFLHAVACALKPAGGQLQLGVHKPWALSRAALQTLRGQLFLAPQVPPLPPRQRVVTATLAGGLPGMSTFASLKSLFYPSNVAGAQAALAQFDLADKLFDRVDRLSGGERQRVGLARLLLAKASLWLVDEPLSALDPTRAVLAMESLTGNARKQGATLICTLHQVEKALAYFPRIVGLRDGELAFDLPSGEVTPELLRQLYAQHEDELTGPAPVGEAVGTALPAVMHCR